MDELENEATKAVIGVGADVLKDTIGQTAVDLWGLAGGDWLGELRKRKRARLAQKTREKLEADGVDLRSVDPDHVDAEIITEIEEGAGSSRSEEILELFADLLAAAIKHPTQVRKTFVEAIEKMDPVDAKVFFVLAVKSDVTLTPGDRVPPIAMHLKMDTDSVLVSFQSLHRIGIVMPRMGGADIGGAVALSPFGRELARCLFKPTELSVAVTGGG